MPKSKTFAEKYPSIDYFVGEMGCIEIGDNEMISSFVSLGDRSPALWRSRVSG
jgi:hypothetical protein